MSKAAFGYEGQKMSRAVLECGVSEKRKTHWNMEDRK